MATVLESIQFDASKLEEELKAFEFLLTKPNLREQKHVLPFFKKHKHLTSYMGTFAPNIGPATHLCFEYEFFGDFRADILLGNLQAKEFVSSSLRRPRTTVFSRNSRRGRIPNGVLGLSTP
jgi:hypothetical protein